MKTRERAVFLKQIADAILDGEQLPVNAVAQRSNNPDLVFRTARQAGYNVFKRKGKWYEGVQMATSAGE